MSGHSYGWVRDRSAALEEQQQELADSFTHPASGAMCSGSRQPTAAELKKIIQKISSERTPDLIVIIDLRDEAHLYCDGEPIGWDYINNDAKGIVRMSEYNREAELEAAQRLQSAHKLELYTRNKNLKPPHDLMSQQINPATIQTEEEIVSKLGAVYQRFPVTDHGVPKPELVDQFIMFVHNLPANTWLHVHCHGGKGRTSTFMAMYNLMYFARNPSAMPKDYDAMNHPKLKTKEDRRTSDEQLKRISFMKNFKLYVNAYAEAINESKAPLLWTEWQKQREIQLLMFLRQHDSKDADQLSEKVKSLYI